MVALITNNCYLTINHPEKTIVKVTKLEGEEQAEDLNPWKNEEPLFKPPGVLQRVLGHEEIISAHHIVDEFFKVMSIIVGETIDPANPSLTPVPVKMQTDLDTLLV